MLDPTFKAKWIAALRSGDYVQTDSLLHRVDGSKHSFCCLGVGCEIKEVSSKYYAADNYYEYDDGERILSDNLQTVFGLTSVEHCILYSLNDGTPPVIEDLEQITKEFGPIEFDHARTFAEIADWIEANL